MSDINIKNRTYYFFNDIINIEDFDPDNIKIAGNSCKNICIYYIGYVTIEKGLKIYSAKTLYLIFGETNGYFEVINENRYLTLVPTNESKEKIKKYEKICIKIKDLIRSRTKNVDNYDEKFDSHDNLPLNKTIKIPIVTIVDRAVFYENNQYYPQNFFGECLCEI